MLSHGLAVYAAAVDDWTLGLSVLGDSDEQDPATAVEEPTDGFFEDVAEMGGPGVRVVFVLQR